jgi:hypothetical protein
VDRRVIALGECLITLEPVACAIGKVITGKDRLTWSCNTSRRATEDPMTDERIALAELLQKDGDSDFLRAMAEGKCIDC